MGIYVDDMGVNGSTLGETHEDVEYPWLHMASHGFTWLRAPPQPLLNLRGPSSMVKLNCQRACSVNGDE